jgi:hypothetical protein
MEKQVIASFEDEIHLSHLVLEGTNEEIGYQIGRLAMYQRARSRPSTQS